MLRNSACKLCGTRFNLPSCLCTLSATETTSVSVDPDLCMCCLYLFALCDTLSLQCDRSDLPAIYNDNQQRNSQEAHSPKANHVRPQARDHIKERVRAGSLRVCTTSRAPFIRASAQSGLGRLHALATVGFDVCKRLLLRRLHSSASVRLSDC